MNSKYRQLLYKKYTSTHIREDGGILLKMRSAYLKNFIKKFFPKDKDLKILEVGCGYGALIHNARILGFNDVMGIDISEEQVLLAEKLGISGISYGNLQEKISILLEGSFGSIIAFDVMEHMDRNELIEFLKSVRRLLVTNGELIMHVPNGASPFFGRVRYGDLTHEICFTQSSISQLLYAMGFKDVRCFEETPVVVGITSAIRWILWKIFRGIMCTILISESGTINEIFSQNMVVVARN